MKSIDIINKSSLLFIILIVLILFSCRIIILFYNEQQSLFELKEILLNIKVEQNDNQKKNIDEINKAAKLRCNIKELIDQNKASLFNIAYYKSILKSKKQQITQLEHQFALKISQLSNFSSKGIYSKELSNLQDQIAMIYFKLNAFKQNKKKGLECFSSSNIISLQSEVDLLKEWIEYGNEIDFHLIYQVSKDGRSSNEFHIKVKDDSYTITLIKLNDGNIIGGYTSKSWNGYGFKHDPKAFIFNLSNRKKYEVRSPFQAIYTHQAHMISFGNRDLVINEKISYSYFPHIYGLKTDKENELTNGLVHFTFTEIEVYRLKNKDN